MTRTKDKEKGAIPKTCLSGAAHGGPSCKAGGDGAAPVSGDAGGGELHRA